MATTGIGGNRLRRRRSRRVIAGVAGGVADALGVRDGYVRAAFITLLMVWGLGAVLYLALWLVTYDDVGDVEGEQVDSVRSVGLGLAFVGLVALLGAVGLWPNPVLVVGAGAISFGVAAFTDPSSPGPFAALIDPGVHKVSRTRLVVGGVLLAGGIVMFGATVGQVFQLGVVSLAVLLTGLGILVAFGPWVRRLVGDLGAERAERIRQEERAEVAAHLHDSVLQTLALIQRSSDPQRMVMLARHQESELRSWLYGNAPLDGVDLVSTALRRAAARVEEDFGVPIDVVTVGDLPVDERARALIGAASEAMVNSAKHSSAARVSLYLEVEDGGATVWVTDQGNGFHPEKVPADRRGIAQSIRARMEKVGGSVELSSDPGEGTEVALRLPR